jgi:hypothetical protein
MKKVLVFAGIAYAAYAFFGKKALTTDNAPTAPGGGIVPTELDFFATYNNKIVVEPKGYWTVIENGKLRAASQKDIQNYEVVNVNQDVWEYYITNFPNLIA